MPMMGIPQDPKASSQYGNISMKNRPSETGGIPPKMMTGQNGNNKMDEDILDRINGVDRRKDIYKSKRSKELGKDEFFTLLSHQLQHQDPMSPMDQNKMMGDLAQLSQLEQLTHVRKALEGQSANKMIEQKFYATGLIGKKVYTSGSSINFKDDGEPALLRFSLDNNAKRVMVRIFDSKSNMVYQEEVKDVPKGFNELSWDGSTLDGTVSAKGTYGFQIMAYDQNDQQIKNETQVSGVVKGVEFKGDSTILVVDDRKVDLNEVDKFELVQENLANQNLNRKEIVKKYDDSSKIGNDEI